MSGVKDEEGESEIKSDAATGTNKKKKRKNKGTLSLWKDRATVKRENAKKRFKI
jgi:hypothetical protein